MLGLLFTQKKMRLGHLLRRGSDKKGPKGAVALAAEVRIILYQIQFESQSVFLRRKGGGQAGGGGGVEGGG
jgi:hypothetical protein